MYISFSKFAKVIPSISRGTFAKQQLHNFMSGKPWRERRRERGDLDGRIIQDMII